ncbi:Serine/threonine-protein phosphatase [Aphelenchoides besseyi]|nr:Serine/threonine-protein phosphatase [Aphelenchoides besseyi]
MANDVVRKGTASTQSEERDKKQSSKEKIKKSNEKTEKSKSKEDTQENIQTMSLKATTAELPEKLVNGKTFRERLLEKETPTKDIPLTDADIQPTTQNEKSKGVATVLPSTLGGMATAKENVEEKLDLKQLIKEHLMKGAVRMEYSIGILHQLLDAARASFQKLPTLVELNAPVNICGDIHGQYSDLMRIFGSCGMPFRSRYLFLGDYVDRGLNSLEVIVFLLACKVQYPSNIVLLRGNHEVYGFNAEIRTRYRDVAQSTALYQHFNSVFAEMPLAAVVSGKILCMHGGLSPHLNSLDDIRRIERPLTVVKGLAQDLLWADPEAGIKGFEANKLRATSHVFGETAVQEKCKQLKIHMVVEYGYAFFANRQLITIFSAARYHDDLCNYAAVVQVDERLEVSFTQLKPVEFEQQVTEFFYCYKKEKVARTQDVIPPTGEDEEAE